MKTSKLIAVFLTLVFIIALTGTAFAQYDNLVERIVKILEDTDSPLSEEQLKEIKDLPQERGFYQKLTDILEDDQNQAVRRAFGRMGAGARPLLLKGGHVVDPANNISGVMDVLVEGGKIARVAKNIRVDEEKTKIVDVKGLVVTPGIIDIHVHCYHTWEHDTLSIIPDHHSFQYGITTVVDAGTSGPESFEHFKETVIDESQVRIFAFINIAAPGMIDEAEQNPRTFNVPLALEMAKKYPDTIVGFKTAHYWRWGAVFDELHTPWASVDSVAKAGRIANLPVMYDHSPATGQGKWPARSYSEFILEKMKPGDIHTHNYARHICVLQQNGKLHPDILKAQRQGKIFDVGHGGGSLVWRNAVPAIKQGFLPNSLSTDLHAGSVKGAMVNMVNVMSKFLNVGLTLEQVIERSTINPAREINHPELGNLSVGSTADIAILKLEKGKYTFLDTSGGKIKGNKKLENYITVYGGRIVFDPYGISYPNWEEIPKDDQYWENISKQYY